MQVTGQFTANGSSASATVPRTSNDVRTFDLSISGLTGTGATVTLQRSFDGGSTWKTVASYTADIEDYGFGSSGPSYLYRLTCSSYTTGTIVYGIG